MNKKKLKTNNLRKVFIIGLLLILAFSILKSFYWVGYKDEPFYFTTALQMIKGETLFTELWGVLGFQGFLLYPLIKGFVLITGGTIGIFIAFRFLYIIIHFVIGIIIYKRLEPFSKVACVAAWMFLLFNPMNHQLLSYNSIPFLFGMLGVVLMATYKHRIELFICGVMFACAVLLQPVLGVEFFVVSIILLIVKRKSFRATIKNYLLFVLGCIATALPVLFYVTKYVKWNKFVEFLGINVGLKSDALHPQAGVLGYFKYYFWAIFPNQKFFGNIGTGIVATIVLFAIAVLFIIQLIAIARKKEPNYLYYRLMIACCAMYSIVCAIATLKLPTTVNMFPWFLVGLLSYKYSNNSFFKKLFKISLCWTVIYGIALLSSDSGMKTLSIALFSTVLVTVMMVYDIYREKIRTHKNSIKWAYVISLICMMVIGASYPIKTIGNVAEAKEGPSKYIRDTKRIAGRYNEIMEDMKYVNSKKKPTLVLSSFVHAYMAYDGKNTQYSAFFNHFGRDPMMRLSKYYKIYPDKKPQALYITYDDLKENSLSDICKVLEFDQSNHEKLKAGYYIVK